jgi:hypothetical protein
MKGTTNAVGMRLTAVLAALFLCVAPAFMPAQRRPAERRAAPHYSAPKAGQGARMRQQQRMNRQPARQNGQFQRQYEGQGGQFQRQPGLFQRQPSQFDQPNRQYQGGNQGEYRTAPAERPYANPEVSRPAFPDGAARDGAYSGVNRTAGEAYAAENYQHRENAGGNRPAQGANRAQPAPANRPAQRPANRPAQPPAAANRYAAPPQRYAAPPQRYAAPPGHLGDWLNQHRNLPVQDQERLLRNSPSFDRLPPDQQQRLVQQLHHLNEMPEPERQRRLAWGEAIERMSPQDRANLNNASRQFADLPPGRKAVVKQAFQDLRTVPVDQRQTVLNSARYQNNFSPQERDILNNFLKVEPYQQPAR